MMIVDSQAFVGIDNISPEPNFTGSARISNGHSDCFFMNIKTHIHIIICFNSHDSFSIVDLNLNYKGHIIWLFSDTVLGAKASAHLYSLVETAKANGLEPYGYLKHVFSELPKATRVEDIEALLPFKPKTELEQAA